MTQYLSGQDSHLGLTASQWHSFVSFSPSQLKAFVVRLPLLSGSPMSAIHLTKTQGCGWFRERNDRMAHLLWTSYSSIQSCKAAICFSCTGKWRSQVTLLMWPPLPISRYIMSTSLQTITLSSCFCRKLAIDQHLLNTLGSGESTFHIFFAKDKMQSVASSGCLHLIKVCLIYLFSSDNCLI